MIFQYVFNEGVTFNLSTSQAHQNAVGRHFEYVGREDG